MKSLFIFICFSLFLVASSVKVYTVVATRYSSEPIVSKSTGSAWDYNYNAAVYNNNGSIGLIVRCQNLKNSSVPFQVGPSYLSASQVAFNSSSFPSATPTKTSAYVPNNTTETCGTEDPRISFFNGTYYLFFTAYNCTNAMLSSAISTNPADPDSWVRNGFVFPEKSWSKSGAVLFATPGNGLSQHYLFWGDSSTPVGGIGIATSSDTIHWKDTGNFLIRIRSDSFDSNLVESGPSPLQLKTGDFLFIYNSARAGYPSVKPDWVLQYNVGFAILNGTDPTTVVQRSDSPIFSPTTDWEIGNTTSYLTPNVVFLEGLIPDPNGCPSDAADNAECFFGVYGGSDSDLGAVRIIVSWTEDTGPITCPMPNYYSNLGAIASSGYPVQYGNNLDCFYHLSVMQGTITIHFNSDFSTEKCCDIVTLYDGVDTTAKVLARVSGKDGANTQYKSSGSFMLVRFTTDASTTDKGWSAYFRATGQTGRVTV